MSARTGLAIALAFQLALTAGAAAAEERVERIRIGTLAPKSSAWGKVFRVWALAVKKKTGRRLKLRFYWNGQQGDEGTMVGKVRAGQLDGAALSARGLSEIHRPILALQMPGLFYDWAGIDRARKAVFPQFKAAVDQEGFFLSSLGDIGRARTMTRGRAVRTPADLKGMKPYGMRGDLIGPVVASVLGVTRVPLSVPEVLPALSQGRINVITAPPLLAEQLQWAPWLDHLNEGVVGIGVGAMVFSKKRMAALDPELVKVMEKTGRKAGAMLRKRVRRQDDDAYQRLKARMTLVRLNTAQLRRWDGIFKRVRARLAQGTFPPELVRKLERIAAQ